jgi:hypothetical protein
MSYSTSMLGTKSLQQAMGLSVIKFFRAFTCMLLEIDKKNDTEKSGKYEKSLSEESNISTNKSQLIGKCVYSSVRI